MENLIEMVKMGDCFNSIQMLRFRKETEYRTFTGGLISIGIIITIAIAFANMIIETMNRTTISYTLEQQRSSNPSLSVLDMSMGKFMFGIEVWHYNLSSEHRYFDLIVTQISGSFGGNFNQSLVALEACTKEHWSMLPDVVAKFDAIDGGNWLCPTKNTVLNLQGKVTSQYYDQIAIQLCVCSNATDPNRPCAPKEEIDAYFQQMGSNYFTLYYVNSVINADQPEYIRYYLQDRAYIVFGPDMGAVYDMYLRQADFVSDYSIWPFEDLSADKAYSIDFSPILYPFAVHGRLLAAFDIMKDSAQENYSREVQKIFVVFSFMGGLIGAMMTALFIVNTYTNFAFEIALSKEVFRAKEDSQQAKLFQSESASLNILHFVKYYAYSFARKWSDRVRSPFYDFVDECRAEILEQLDVRNLVKRVIFLEYCTSFLLEDFQLAEMQHEKPTLPSGIRKLRHKIQSKAQIAEEELESAEDSLKEPRNQFDRKNIKMAKMNGLESRRKFSILISHSFQGQAKENQNRNQIDCNMDDPLQDNIINAVVYDEGRFDNMKKKENIRKLRQSASKGNMVSKRLLQIVSYQRSEESVSSVSLN